LYKTSPGYFYQLGYEVNSVSWMRADSSPDLRAELVTRSRLALEEFVNNQGVWEMLPRSVEAAKTLLLYLKVWVFEPHRIENLPVLKQHIQSFSTIFIEDVERTHHYTLTEKGNLSVDRLISGASAGYPSEVLKCLDVHITKEIDEAGRCLACTLNTACGFHILHSVEIGIKGYVHALKNRNWGGYIDALDKAGATGDVVDVLKILKTKHNPLMHPQDSLEEDEAIDIFCICQAATGAIVKEVKNKALEVKFAASLALLPTT
jgi:hypothetical protein